MLEVVEIMEIAILCPSTGWWEGRMNLCPSKVGAIDVVLDDSSPHLGCGHVSLGTSIGAVMPPRGHFGN